MSVTDTARRMAEIAARAADEKLADNIRVVDVSDVLAITEIFVIASADNERQVRSVVDEIDEELSAEGFEPKRREGNRENRWVLLDYGNIVVHVQRDSERDYYGLDRLYHDCPVIEVVGIDTPESVGAWGEDGVLPRDAESQDDLSLAQRAPGEDEEF